MFFTHARTSRSHPLPRDNDFAVSGKRGSFLVRYVSRSRLNVRRASSATTSTSGATVAGRAAAVSAGAATAATRAGIFASSRPADPDSASCAMAPADLRRRRWLGCNPPHRRHRCRLDRRRYRTDRRIQPSAPFPPTKTASVSPGVTRIVACTKPPLPAEAAAGRARNDRAAGAAGGDRYLRYTFGHGE